MEAGSRWARGRAASAKTVAHKLPEAIGSVVGAAVGVGAPLLFDATNPAWITGGAVVGALVGAALPPTAAFLAAAATHGHYLIMQRLDAIDERLAGAGSMARPVRSKEQQQLDKLALEGTMLLSGTPGSPLDRPAPDLEQRIQGWEGRVAAALSAYPEFRQQFLGEPPTISLEHRLLSRMKCRRGVLALVLSDVAKA